MKDSRRRQGVHILMAMNNDRTNTPDFTVKSWTSAACDPPNWKERRGARKATWSFFKKHERITELGHIEMAVWRNSGSLSLQRLTSLRRLGEAVTGTRTALFLLHLSNLRKPRVRKHKVFSKLVNRPLKRSQRSQQPSDKVPSHYHSIDSRDFAYLTGNFTLLFWHGALCILCT